MTKQSLQEMIDLQYSINVKAAGKNWLSGVTNKGRKINWARTIYMETAELIDSYPWKHWKDLNAEPDILNAKIEVVDLWHFIMSLVMEEVAKTTSTYIKEKTVEKILLWKNTLDIQTTEHFDIYEQILYHSTKLAIFKEDNIERTISLISLVAYFFKAVEILDLNLEKIFKGKNILNSFRQDHGYKEGTYIKQWNYKGKTVEDNIVMVDLIEEKDLYQALEKVYQNQKG